MASLRDRDEKVFVVDNEDNEIASFDDSGNLILAGDVSLGDDVTIGDDLTITGDVEIDGALNHDGTTVGFRGVAPAAMPTAYTQTYSTAARTVPAEVAAITGGESPTEAEHNLVVADLLALKKVITALIDDLQAIGLAQ